MNAKILLISPFFYPHKGGSQQYAEELHAAFLKKNPNSKVDVLTYNTDNMPEVEKYRDFTIYRVPCYQLLKGQFVVPNYIALLKTLKILLKKNNYTLINSHTRFFETSWWTPLVAKVAGTKSVLTDHCAHHPTHKNKLVTEIAKTIDIITTPILNKLYNHVTVTNQATKKFVKSLGITTPKLIYGGVDTQYFTPKKRKNLRQLPGLDKKFRKNDIIISFVGRMIESKGPEIALKVAEKIIKNNKNIYFIFTGNGPLYKNLSKNKHVLRMTHKDSKEELGGWRAERDSHRVPAVNNVSEDIGWERSAAGPTNTNHKIQTANDYQIFLLGERSKKDIAKIMANSDILIHPSTHHEGFPNVLLEAAASGCAIITTDRGGTKEIIENEKNGLLVESDQKEIKKSVENLIKSPKLRKKLGDQARKDMVKKYDWKKIANQYASFIQKI